VRGRPAHRLVLAALALVACAWLAVAATAFSAPIVALQDDALSSPDNPVTAPGPKLNARLDQLAATGARWTRVDILWNQVAPTQPRFPRDPDDPAYDWRYYDAVFRGLQARGLAAIVDFYRTPKWASVSGDPRAAPRAADSAAFAGALALRYNGHFADARGPLPEVRRIEVWNEPNFGDFWLPQCHQTAEGRVLDSPRAYAAVLAASYREIKRANPRATVIGGVAGPAGDTASRCPDGGDISVGTADFIAKLAREKVRLDAWSQHVYPIGGPTQAVFFPSWTTMPKLQALVDKLRKGAPIYVTETGYHTSYNRYHRYWVSERQQAAFLTQTYQVAARYPRVQIAVWFNLQDNPQWTGGLLRADGSRKPAYRSFVALASAGQLPASWEP
jgi:hypothetical protein